LDSKTELRDRRRACRRRATSLEWRSPRRGRSYRRRLGCCTCRQPE
jgi:hypothetical protein